MDYQIHTQFLNDSFCRYLIGLLDKESNPVQYETNCVLIDLYDKALTHDNIKILLQRLTRFGFENFGGDRYVQQIQVVKRTDMGMIIHKDHDRHENAMVCFLNDNYQGGQAIVAGERIEPEVGKAITLQGNTVSHGVMRCSGDRYVLLCWWSRAS
jgi:hypothetical protein